MFVHVYLSVCICAQALEEVRRSPGTGVTGYGKPPNVSVEY